MALGRFARQSDLLVPLGRARVPARTSGRGPIDPRPSSSSPLLAASIRGYVPGPDGQPFHGCPSHGQTTAPRLLGAQAPRSLAGEKQTPRRSFVAHREWLPVPPRPSCTSRAALSARGSASAQGTLWGRLNSGPSSAGASRGSRIRAADLVYRLQQRPRRSARQRRRWPVPDAHRQPVRFPAARYELSPLAPVPE